ncbi:MAG TPA: glycosyltransferase [Candidatus Dojkabacteria bacterium]|nr:glycosyltransferase [Candidatus Dojkabacteria bacterium]
MQSKREELKKKIIITGGGSGGHISAAKAIIDEIKERFRITSDNLLYIGSDLGMVGEKPGSSLDMKVMKKERINQRYIRGGKLQRRFSLRGIYLLLRTILGFVDSYKILSKYKPDIIISTGGFVTVPVCLIGKFFFKAKIYLHEQTAAVGLSNKIVGKYAEKILIAYPLSEDYFPKEKTILTGNPVRKEVFLDSGKTPLTTKLKKMIEQQEEFPIIYISGGSLGSHLINKTIKQSMINLLQDFQIILQTGDSQITNDYNLLNLEKDKLEPELRERIFITKYVQDNEIGCVFNNIDMFIGRAGANTVYEMGLMSIPSILIPIPWVTHNEQMRNAEVLKDVGLARIIREGELTPEKLVMTTNLFAQEKRHVDEEKRKRIFIPNAAQKIVDNINFN